MDNLNTVLDEYKNTTSKFAVKKTLQAVIDDLKAREKNNPALIKKYPNPITEIIKELEAAMGRIEG